MPSIWSFCRAISGDTTRVGPSRSSAGHLVDRRLPGPGRQHGQHVVPGHHLLHRLELVGPQLRPAERPSRATCCNFSRIQHRPALPAGRPLTQKMPSSSQGDLSSIAEQPYWVQNGIGSRRSRPSGADRLSRHGATAKQDQGRRQPMRRAHLLLDVVADDHGRRRRRRRNAPARSARRTDLGRPGDPARTGAGGRPAVVLPPAHDAPVAIALGVLLGVDRPQDHRHRLLRRLVTALRPGAGLGLASGPGAAGRFRSEPVARC